MVMTSSPSTGDDLLEFRWEFPPLEAAIDIIVSPEGLRHRCIDGSTGEKAEASVRDIIGGQACSCDGCCGTSKPTPMCARRVSGLPAEIGSAEHLPLNDKDRRGVEAWARHGRHQFKAAAVRAHSTVPLWDKDALLGQR